MTKLETIIEKITAFGKHPTVAIKDKESTLQVLLAKLYVLFLIVEVEPEETSYSSPPPANYEEIRKNVAANFPGFGWYSTILEAHKMPPTVEVGLGDEVDDLTDIIIDLLAVQWRMNTTSRQDALWHFKFLMSVHSEQHLLDLLTHIKKRKE